MLVTHLSVNVVDRAAQIPALLRHAQTQASPLMVMGDLNAELAELKALSPFLRNAAGDDPHPTYPASMPEHAIDHIYVTKEIEIVQAAMPLPLMGSDHLAVMAKVRL